MKGKATLANKARLPSKPCAACGRPFTWRRKWARDWDNVRYCSDACRTGKRDATIERQRRTAS
ncbi:MULTISPECIES: DUF2256 domain-containing protein [Acidiphilium]|uniref:DUF2256 domain-containing protein n=1 Tax=Acidiphilium TaxID=522 RepID=UPI000970FCC4|nr:MULTISPECIES: DUF2256 domain-containing protein [Acidiphilium]MBW4034104.1 DUF2256 domain-containing protein [Pseudomonadota bacterium]